MTKLTEFAFVNVNGDEINPNLFAKPKPRPKKDEESYHNGWRVVGIPPGAMEAAKQEHEAEIADAMLHAEKYKGFKIPPAWDEDLWRRNFKKKAVRSKPYSIPEAAEQCKLPAAKAGWENLEINEIKKEVRQ